MQTLEIVLKFIYTLNMKERDILLYFTVIQLCSINDV